MSRPTNTGVYERRHRAIVVAPGRGSYNGTHAKYFNRYERLRRVGHEPSAMRRINAHRCRRGLPSVDDLVTSPFFQQLRKSNPNILTFTAGVSDYATLSDYNVQCIVSNSIGWYTALALADVIEIEHALDLLHVAGETAPDGGQVVYPLIDANWHPDPEAQLHVDRVLAEVNARDGNYAAVSLQFGGFVVLAGNGAAIEDLSSKLPTVVRGHRTYPHVLVGNPPAHTRLMKKVGRELSKASSSEMWHEPTVPIVDGFGRLWSSRDGCADALRRYTVGPYVTDLFDFTVAVQTALNVFQPDRIVLLGPGDNHAGAIAQAIVDMGYRGIRSRNAFFEAQAETKLLVLAGTQQYEVSLHRSALAREGIAKG